MLAIRRILCPVDFSEFSNRAYEYAHSFAQYYGAKIFIQHVAEPFSIPYDYASEPLIDRIYSQQTAEAEEKMHRLAAEHAQNGVEQELVLERGPVADSILQFAEDNEIDLITIGTHGRRGLDRLVLGSVTERVLRRARCPVLAVHNPVQDTGISREQPGDIRQILFCTDFSDNSPRPLEYTLSLASKCRAEISLLHVIERSTYDTGEDSGKERILQQLHALIPENLPECVTVATTVRIGRAYQEILEYALEIQADLIVMGVRGRNAVDLALFGSTTHRVIQLGPCPVLVVRT